MKNSKRLLGMTTALSLAALQATAEAPETEQAIKIALNNWSSQNLSSYVVGGVLESMGYSVEYIQADAMAQFAGLETGDITLQTEIWPTTQGARFADGLSSGNLADLGSLGLSAQEEWWYPLYMKEHCPTLPDWTALLEAECAQAFSSPQTAPNGRYLGGPASWEGFDDERVEALGLPWTVIHAGSDAAMWAELDSAYKRKAPIMMWVFSPHWWPTKYEGEFVQFPAYAEECYNDVSWGMNTSAKYDCGKPMGELHKTAWAGGADIWPSAYDTIANVSFSLDQYAALISAVDLDGNDAKDVADQWLAENESIWKSWVN